MLAQRLNGAIFAHVPHRQWVFTMPTPQETQLD
ncbi:MAG: hypothetical protein GF331_05920 [Chitinivibrionales bacterium]|nr:hypothetical protein [Chitinivibrionales bacterium]